VNLRKKTILFLMLLSPALLFPSNESFKYRLKHSFFSIIRLPKLQSLRKKIRKSQEPYKAPEYIQNFVQDYFDKITADGNIFQKAIARYKKKAGLLTLYIGGEDEKMNKRGSILQYRFGEGGITVHSDIFKRDGFEKLKTKLHHEIEHTKQDMIILNPLIWPFFKMEYMAEKERIKNFVKFGSEEEINSEKLDIICKFLPPMKIEKKKYPYLYGEYDGLLEAIPNLFCEKEKSKIKKDLCKKYYKKYGPPSSPDKQKKIEKFFKEQLDQIQTLKPAKNWRQRYKQYKKEFPTVWKPRVPVIEG